MVRLIAIFIIILLGGLAYLMVTGSIKNFQKMERKVAELEEQRKLLIDRKKVFLMSEDYSQFNIVEIKHKGTYGYNQNIYDIFNALLSDKTIIQLEVYDLEINGVYKVVKA